MAAHSTARRQPDLATPNAPFLGASETASVAGPPAGGWSPYEVWRTRVLNAAPVAATPSPSPTRR
jgi:hypothetical protein